MKMPRDVSADHLVRRLSVLGYGVSHQTGSHVRLTTARDGEHHLTIPDHKPIKVGTLSSILRSLERHHRLTRPELLALLKL